jgi:hypothetical protein
MSATKPLLLYCLLELIATFAQYRTCNNGMEILLALPTNLQNYEYTTRRDATSSRYLTPQAGRSLIIHYWKVHLSIDHPHDRLTYQTRSGSASTLVSWGEWYYICILYQFFQYGDGICFSQRGHHIIDNASTFSLFNPLPLDHLLDDLDLIEIPSRQHFKPRTVWSDRSATLYCRMFCRH